MSYCPNCSTELAADSRSCRNCSAQFGDGGAWKLVPSVHSRSSGGEMPIFFRWVLGFVLMLASIPFSVLAVSAAISGETKQMRVLTEEEHNLVSRSTSFIEKFKDEHQRLPTADEFRTWMLSDPRERFKFEFFGFRYLPATGWYSPSLVRRIGGAPAGGYVFEWRLYGHSTLPSWSPQRQSAYLVDEHYFSFGSKWRDVSFFGGIALLLLAALLALGPRKGGPSAL